VDFLAAQKRPINLICKETFDRLGPHVNLVSLSQDDASIVNSNGVRDATNDKVALNSWHDRNPTGGFGVVGEYSDITGLWVPHEITILDGFELSDKVHNSPCVNFLSRCEQDDWELYGQIYFLEGSDSEIQAGVIGGKVTKGIPNSGCRVLPSRKPLPVGGWNYYSRSTRIFQKHKIIKLVWS
jgi:hypothetical protein